MNTYYFDLGNTRLKFACAGDEAVNALVHDDAGFRALLEAMLPRQFDKAVVAMVGPIEVRAVLLEVLSRRAKLTVIARTIAEFGGLRIAYGVPSRLGVDRFLAMLSLQPWGTPMVLASVGTALTIDLLDGEGRHLGGRIAPSPTLMRASLAAESTALPTDGGIWATNMPFADDTDHALASGCEGAAVALIEESVRLARESFPDVRVLVHGGGAADLLPYLKNAESLPDGIVLRGLAKYCA